jgi:hypothetical protein
MLLGSRPAHHLATVYRLLFFWGRFGILVVEQFLHLIWPFSPLVRVQRRHQRCPLLHQPHSCMPPSVYPPFVSLGQSEPSFQVQIVLDVLVHLRPHEQSCRERHHHYRHLDPRRVPAACQTSFQSLKPPLPLFATPLTRVQRRFDSLHLLDVFLDLLLLSRDGLQSSVDTALELA